MFVQCLLAHLVVNITRLNIFSHTPADFSIADALADATFTNLLTQPMFVTCGNRAVSSAGLARCFPNRSDEIIAAAWWKYLFSSTNLSLSMCRLEKFRERNELPSFSLQCCGMWVAINRRAEFCCLACLLGTSLLSLSPIVARGHSSYLGHWQQSKQENDAVKKKSQGMSLAKPSWSVPAVPDQH